MPSAQPPPAVGRLSVVIPVYNEPTWIPRTTARLARELAVSPWDVAEIVLVDDGSTDDTPAVLDALDLGVPTVVIHQANQGRLAARRAGLAAVTGDVTFLLDSRVLLSPGALAFVYEEYAAGAHVWNGHVHVQVDGSPFPRFWDAITKAAWSDYFRAPRRVAYGLDDFDRYPKGTGCFLAPTSALRDANAAFVSRYADDRQANDDTTVIRHIAEQEPINLSPEFACEYEGRRSFGAFVKHARQRGVFFVDGHFRKGARFAPIIAAFYLCTLLAVPIAIAWWPAVPLGLVALLGGVLGIGYLRGLQHRDAWTLAALSPLFLVVYGAGMWRGLFLAVKGRA